MINNTAVLAIKARRPKTIAVQEEFTATTLELPRNVDVLQRFTGALRTHRSEHDIADYSLAIDEERGRRTKDAIGAFDGIVQIQGDREN